MVNYANATIDQCKSFAKGIVDESLALAMSRHFENMRYILTLYSSLMKDPTMDFPGTVYNFTDDPGRNKILSILNLNISYEISNKDFIIYLYNVRYDAGYIHSTHIQVADSRLQ